MPLAVLDRLHPVPAAFLKQARAARRRLRAAARGAALSRGLSQLAADMELFRQLPCGVQRQARACVAAARPGG